MSRTRRPGMSPLRTNGKKKVSKAVAEFKSHVAYKLRTKYGIYSDMPKAKSLDKNLRKGESKGKLGAGRVS